MAQHQVDADEAEEMKRTGDYKTGEDKEAPADDAEKKSEDGKGDESWLSDEDPDKPSTDADKSDSDDTSDDDKSEDDKTKDDLVEQFGEQATKWTEEFMEKGELSDETREAIGKAVFAPGVPQEQIDAYIDSYTQNAAAAGQLASLAAYDVVGGAENYANMIKWGKQNLSEEQIEAFDGDITGSDISRRDTAIQGLYARMQQDVGFEPDTEKSLAHDGGRGKGEPIIGSRVELAKIQGTERYKKDPAYRDLVERQLRQSMATGQYRND